MRIIGLVLAALLATPACVPLAPPTHTTPSAYQAATVGMTGVYINGQELTADQKAQLDAFLGGELPAGRYTVDARYQLGVEGEPPSVDLVAIARAREQQSDGKKPLSMYSTDAAGRGSSLVSSGDCIMLSTPHGSMSSGC